MISAGEFSAALRRREATGFVRGGMLFLEPPRRWRVWYRDIWKCCSLARAGDVARLPMAREAVRSGTGTPAAVIFLPTVAPRS